MLTVRTSASIACGEGQRTPIRTRRRKAWGSGSFIISGSLPVWCFFPPDLLHHLAECLAGAPLPLPRVHTDLSHSIRVCPDLPLSFCFPVKCLIMNHLPADGLQNNLFQRIVLWHPSRHWRLPVRADQFDFGILTLHVTVINNDSIGSQVQGLLSPLVECCYGLYDSFSYRPLSGGSPVPCPWGRADERNSPPFRLGIQTQMEEERELDRQMELTV